MSAEEWEAIPDVVADHTLKFKQGQNKKDSFQFTPVPDYLIAGREICTIQICTANLRLSLSTAKTATAPISAIGGMESSLGGMSSVFSGGMHGNQSIISGLAAEARGAAL